MLKSKVVEQGLEDGELSLQGVEVLVAERGAVGSILTGEGGAVLEGREPDAAAGRHIDGGQYAHVAMRMVRYSYGTMMQWYRLTLRLEILNAKLWVSGLIPRPGQVLIGSF